MARCEETTGDASDDAIRLYSEFLRGAGDDEPGEFEELCARHPDRDDELRQLRHHWQSVGGVLEELELSGTVSQRLRSRFGPDADPRVTLDPASGADAEFPDRVLERLASRKGGFGRYRVLGHLGRGGMGAVLRVWDEDLRRSLAMKVMLGKDGRDRDGDSPDADSRTLGRFLEEAQVTGQLDHPGIAPVHELGLDARGRVYFTMKLVKGQTLTRIFEHVHEGREDWTPTGAVGVLSKVCEAMAYAHEKGVIHRDLKPANVMVGRFGAVYVMDWGLARVAGREDEKDIRIRDAATLTSEILSTRHDEVESDPDSPLVTMDGDVVGTPAYMSPEQAAGRVDEVGPPTDVYSVGAMLYHLLTGRMPYAEPAARVSARTTLVMLLLGPPKPIRDLASNVPAELAAICEKAMARKPEDRYAGVQELAGDLRAYLEGRVVRAYEVGAVAELRKWVRRNRGLAASAAAAVALAFGGLSSTTYVQAKSASEILRLSDLTRVQKLEERAEELWPAHPERIGDYRAWLRDARDVASRLDLHRAELEAMRREALPWTDRERQRDRKTHPRAEEIDYLHFKRAETERRLEALEVGDIGQPPDGQRGVETLEQGRLGLAGMEERIAELEEELGRRRTWTFEDPAAQLSHDTLAAFVHRLEVLAHTIVRDVAERLEFAGHVEEDTVAGAEARALWGQATASIRDTDTCPMYRGLEIAPQLGLLPIGRDPDSELWEFAHTETGRPPERNPQTGELDLTEDSGLVFVLAPGGTFRMGDPSGHPNESPVVEVALDPFFISKYEMTQGQWLRFTGENPSYYTPGVPLGWNVMSLSHPVENVSWTDCAEVTKRMRLELPTEAQWEYAARAGGLTRWSTGAFGTTLEGAANLADKSWELAASWEGKDYAATLGIHDDGHFVHAPVGSFTANAFGLHDVHGNVAEWCRDEASSYDVRPDDGDGLRRARGAPDRIHRGGGHDGSPDMLRSAARAGGASNYRHPAVGLRPIRVLEE